MECDPASARSSARSGQYRLDTPVRGRLRRQLVERLVEEHDGLFAMASAALNEAEIGDDARLVLVVAECAQDVERVLELLDGGIPGSATSEGETEVVARERLTAPVTQVCHDRERSAMLCGRLGGVALSSQPTSALVEPRGPATRVVTADSRNESTDSEPVCACLDLVERSSNGVSGRPQDGRDLELAYSIPSDHAQAGDEHQQRQHEDDRKEGHRRQQAGEEQPQPTGGL
jgi:hypothetical protein